MIVLDSDIVIDALREHPQAVAWFERIHAGDFVVSAMTAMELIEGARDAAGLRKVRAFLSTVMVHYPEEALQRKAIDLLIQLRPSHGLGHVDAIIAATALMFEAPLYSFNRKHFGVVPGLRLVEPYVR